MEEFQSNSKGMEHKLEEISEIEETFWAPMGKRLKWS